MQNFMALPSPPIVLGPWPVLLRCQLPLCCCTLTTTTTTPYACPPVPSDVSDTALLHIYPGNERIADV